MPSRTFAMAIGVAILLFILAFAVLAVPLFFAAIVLAGPHSDLLPAFVQPAVLLLAWATLLGVPLWLAIRAYRWQMRRARPMRGAA